VYSFLDDSKKIEDYDVWGGILWDICGYVSNILPIRELRPQDTIILSLNFSIDFSAAGVFFVV